MSELLSEIRSRIEALAMNFQFIGTIKTKMNGIERETWLLEYEGAQFVYVAGQKNVVLGWDVEQCSLGKGVIEGLRQEFAGGHEYYEQQIEYLKEYYQKQIDQANADGNIEKAEELLSEQAEELKNYKEEMTESGYGNWEVFMAKWNEKLSECLSPLRTVDIGDMIVEVDNRYLEEDAPSLAEAVSSLKEGPFTLATEDEWEYLCNGGARTLFRWGDILNDDILERIFSEGTVSQSRESEETLSALDQNNMLGLFIAYNAYKIEIIDHTQFTKGGDGGCSLCGGDGAIHVLPCYTAFYRGSLWQDIQNLSKNYYCYRRIIRLS